MRFMRFSHLFIWSFRHRLSEVSSQAQRLLAKLQRSRIQSKLRTAVSVEAKTVPRGARSNRDHGQS